MLVNVQSSEEHDHQSAFAYPILSAALSLAIGVLIDRWLSPAYLCWLVLLGCTTVGWWVCWSNNRLAYSAVLILLCILSLGGLRHHARWSATENNDINLFASTAPKLIRLTGKLISKPRIVSKTEDPVIAAWPQHDHSYCKLNCQSLVTQSGLVPVSGIVQMNVTGHLYHADVGDTVEVCGKLSQSFPPQNPGEFDFRNYYKAQQIRSVLFVQFPDAITVQNQSSRWNPAYIRSRLLDSCDQLIIGNLSEPLRPVAATLLLGKRLPLPESLRTAFAESGTMHLLAISGLHVGIFAGLLWLGCRLLNSSQTLTTFVLLVGILGYAFLTETRAPVLRATLLIVFVLVGQYYYRAISFVQLLSCAFVALLLWNPTELFNVGAQLSFLAVAGIGIANNWYRTFQTKRAKAHPLKQLLENSSPWRRHIVFYAKATQRAYFITGTIWLLTTPLVAMNFNLIAPIALLITALLLPIVTVIMWTGFLFLFCGLMVPASANILGPVFDCGLSLLVYIVEWAAQLQFGHVYLPEFSLWWVLGFYGFLIVALLVRSQKKVARWRWHAVVLWICLGLFLGLRTDQPGSLRCTFLSVGHGCSVLLELPNGRVLLYDAGSLNRGNRVHQLIRSALWNRRHSAIDAVVVSHADIDHFNALPQLFKTVPVGSLLCAQSFLDFQQTGVVQVCDTAEAANIPIKILLQGDRLLLDEDVTIEVLHPETGPPHEHDNENSVVLAVEFAGRRILLTGDLEAAGMQQFLKQPARRAQILQSPHHGSLAANPVKLAHWAKPNYTVISTGRDTDLEKFHSIYGAETKIFSTFSSGAVTFKISADGEISHRTVLQDGI